MYLVHVVVAVGVACSMRTGNSCSELFFLLFSTGSLQNTYVIPTWAVSGNVYSDYVYPLVNFCHLMPCYEIPDSFSVGL